MKKKYYYNQEQHWVIFFNTWTLDPTIEAPFLWKHTTIQGTDTEIEANKKYTIPSIFNQKIVFNGKDRDGSSVEAYGNVRVFKIKEGENGVYTILEEVAGFAKKPCLTSTHPLMLSEIIKDNSYNYGVYPEDCSSKSPVVNYYYQGDNDTYQYLDARIGRVGDQMLPPQTVPTWKSYTRGPGYYGMKMIDSQWTLTDDYYTTLPKYTEFKEYYLCVQRSPKYTTGFFDTTGTEAYKATLVVDATKTTANEFILQNQLTTFFMGFRFNGEDYPAIAKYENGSGSGNFGTRQFQCAKPVSVYLSFTGTNSYTPDHIVVKLSDSNNVIYRFNYNSERSRYEADFEVPDRGFTVTPFIVLTTD